LVLFFGFGWVRGAFGGFWGWWFGLGVLFCFWCVGVGGLSLGGFFLGGVFGGVGLGLVFLLGGFWGGLVVVGGVFLGWFVWVFLVVGSGCVLVFFGVLFFFFVWVCCFFLGDFWPNFQFPFPCETYHTFPFLAFLPLITVSLEKSRISFPQVPHFSRLSNPFIPTPPSTFRFISRAGSILRTCGVLRPLRASKRSVGR